MNKIDNYKLKHVLDQVEKPGRYVGCELYGRNKSFNPSKLRAFISYPDLYEIGMSNLGLSIIFDMINSIDRYFCDRVFAPWPDFEKCIRNENIPLYGLSSMIPLKEFCVAAFTIQYELTLTNMLNILDLGKIPVLTSERGSDDPIVLLGGPAVYNPFPFLPFADAIFIGEAESGLLDILATIENYKSKVSRKDLIEKLSEIPGVITNNNKTGTISRQVYSSFYNSNGPEKYLIPLIDVVHNKLNVEIMRGCPNKCRFCQAGMVYKPHREKSLKKIIDDINVGLKETGVDEVTFSSLSSGDFSKIIELSDYFNNLFKSKSLSFALPSLKIESFNTDMLERLNLIRKSGLTFAVETGDTDTQLTINKLADIDKIIEITKFAIQKGWKQIKLYFMIGLPFVELETEVNSIITFIDKIRLVSRKLSINVNIAVFVPKPHTPFQYEKQLNPENAKQAFQTLDRYYQRSKVKIKYHNPYISFLEGILTRGSERSGLLFYEAFLKGARFDGWDEHFDYNLYKSLIEETKFDFTYLYSAKDTVNQVAFPWSKIDIGYNSNYFNIEKDNSLNKVLSDGCKISCDENCGICSDDLKTIENKDSEVLTSFLNRTNNLEDISKNTIESLTNFQKQKHYFLIEFQKTGFVRYIGHIDIIKYFEKLFRRADIKILFSEGFNPRPLMQFSPPLSLGIESKSELMIITTDYKYTTEELINQLSLYEHQNLKISRLKEINKFSSIFNHIHFYRFNVTFQSSIIQKTQKFQESGFVYDYEKKGKQIMGNFSDIISIDSFDDKSAVFLYKIIESKPNFLTFLKMYYPDFNDIVKISQFSVLNDTSIDAFDSIG